MAVNDKIFLSLVFVVLWCYGSPLRCAKLDSQLQQLCSKINGGYNSTSGGFESSYQSRAYSKVLHLQRALKTCSNVSDLMICSSFVPKCGVGKTPVLPCRDVCEQFVQQCGGKLDERNLRVLYATMCHEFLSGHDCIRPQGFKKEAKDKRNAISLQCSTQTFPACIHGNHTHLPEDIRAKLIKQLNQIDASIKNGCSEQLKRYLCYRQTTPCFMNGKPPYRPCRSFCEKVKKECEREIKLLNLSSPLCEELPKEGDRVGDLCRMESWPVPWVFRRVCHCDNCGQMRSTCETTGSCFIQKRLNISGNMYTQRTCLHPGKQRDFICGNTKNYSYAKCCEQDYCNKEYLGTTPTPHIVATSRQNRSSITTGHETHVPHTGATLSNIVVTPHEIYVTDNGTTRPNIVATPPNSSSTTTGQDGINFITVKMTLVSVLVITVGY